MVSLPAPNNASAKTYLEHLNQQKLLQFLMGLNELYFMVRSQILLVNPLPSVKQAYSVVNQDESQRILVGLNTNADVTTTLCAHNGKNHNPWQRYKGKKPYIECDYCHLPSHKRDNCYKLNGYPADYQFTKGKGNSKSKYSANQVQSQETVAETTDAKSPNIPTGPVFTSEQYNQILELLGKENSPTAIKPSSKSIVGLADGTKSHIAHDLYSGKLKGIDVWGPHRIPTHGNARYFLTLVDDFSRVTCKDIVHQSSCVYSPQQNRVVERKHRHIIAVARALKFQSNIRNHLWGYCVQIAVYLINRFPSSVLKDISPFERFFGHPPSLDHIKVFSCLAYATILTPKDKLSPRSTPCVFLGYSLTQNGYFLYDISSHKSFVTRDVLFHETIFPFTWSTSPSSPFPFDPEFLDIELPSTTTTPTVPLSVDLLPVVQHAEPTGPPSPSINSSPPQPSIPLRKSNRLTRPPIWTSDFVCLSISPSTSNSATCIPYPIFNFVSYSHISPSYQAFLSHLNLVEPSSFNKASQDPNWVVAMQKEIQALE
ncbi:uncharacterized protein LOC116123984 [Pistacia vera]|uniref:uncharacterized protein LOC116123984 n=1 Tax=Pistacia vera TaxID=55513 RepID=UPI0012634BDD|nr:uncharacterized protein LOC116123984 [Pistacia vera]